MIGAIIFLAIFFFIGGGILDAVEGYIREEKGTTH